MDININDKGNIPLAKLSELVGIRAGEMEQSVKDSAIASMIQILTSLRRATLKAKVSATTNPKIELQPHLRVSVTRINKGIKVLCVRDSSGHRVASTKELPIRFAERGIHAKYLQVYLITPEYRNTKKYLLVAKSESVAQKYEQSRVKQWIKAHRGFAKYVMSLLQHDLSNNSSIEQFGSDKLKEIEQKVRDSKVEENEKSTKVTVEDKLNYAISALRNGKIDIDDSIKKAANKVSGLIAQAMKRYGISRPWQTPFPEVKQRRG